MNQCNTATLYISVSNLVMLLEHIFIFYRNLNGVYFVIYYEELDTQITTQREHWRIVYCMEKIPYNPP